MGPASMPRRRHAYEPGPEPDLKAVLTVVAGSDSGRAAVASRLRDVSKWSLEVVEAWNTTPSMRRVRFTGPGIEHLAYKPGQDLMFSVPAADGTTYRRRYTIRAFDPGARTVDVDIVLHGHGPGATWAAAVEPGGRVDALGPRGKVTVDPEARWHLFVADDSALPGSLAMAETVEASRSSLIVEVDGPDDEQPAVGADGAQLDVRWLHRGDDDPASASRLLEAVRIVTLGSGPGHAYVAGELRVVAAVSALLRERGMTGEQISSKPYWRAGVANAAHGEPDRD
ncbi:MAG: siderophore-interacting protein [Acidimicrobiales bacterium]